MKRVKICIFTGTRAEYGLLRPLVEDLKKERVFDVQLLVSGMHLSTEFGLTYKQIEADRIEISEKVEMLLSSDTPAGITKSIGLGLIGYADTLHRLKPDVAMVLGDRFEALAFAIACYVARIPLIHLYGGEATYGSLDEGFRHCITKLSYLHFTSTEQYRQIVIQLGEDPSRVFNVGALGIDNIKRIRLLSKEEIEVKLGVKFRKVNFLVTYHPVTLETNTSEFQIRNIIRAVERIEDEYAGDVFVIFTRANADTEGRIINRIIDEYAAKNPDKAVAFTSLGQELYLSIMKHVDAVIGNSSSGIIEAPSLKVPTVNIGDRQKGRIKAESVIDCSAEVDDIYKSIRIALSEEFKEKVAKVINPYGDGKASERIVNILKKKLSDGIDIKKSFYRLT